jgi:hypothetical protein
MQVTLTVVRCEKATDEVKGGEKGPRLVVAASSLHGAWNMRLPMEFAQHVHVGQTLLVNLEVGQ